MTHFIMWSGQVISLRGSGLTGFALSMGVLDYRISHHIIADQGNCFMQYAAEVNEKEAVATKKHISSLERD
jgi:hypothetical protein